MTNDKAKSNWCKIRDAIYGNLQNPQPLDDEVEFTLNTNGYGNVKKHEEFTLHHGIENTKTSTINYAQSYVAIKNILYNQRSNCYVITFTDGNLCCFRGHTTKQEIFKCSQPVYEIVFAEKYKKYITLCRDNALRILSEDFELINTIPHSGFVNGLVYNQYTNEIVTYGVGCFTIWMFRTAGTILVPKKIVSENILSNNPISYLDIEQTYSESQRCFVVIGKDVLVFHLQSGECLHEIADAHNVDISSIMFYKPLQALVTAACDGSIKTWKLYDSFSWELSCLFIGHTAKVTSLAEFPYGPFVVSSSVDGTIRTWSLDTSDEMNCQTLEYAVLGLGVQNKRFFSFSKFLVTEWKINNLYSPFTVLGSRVKLLTSTKYPFLQSVVACIGDDACARIICPISGEIVTVFISHEYVAIKDIVCIVSEEILFALLTDGKIIKASMKHNPCSITQTWDRSSTLAPSTVTCFTLFEYHAPKVTEDTSSLHQPTTIKDKKKGEEQKKKLVIGGCMDGTIVIFDWLDDSKRGRITFSLQAHREEIICMAVNTGLNQLATASQDLTLKVWRVFPFASEALAPIAMFMNEAVVTHLRYSHHSLGVVYQDTSKSSFSFAMYLTKSANSAKHLYHDLDDDHSDTIMSMDACPKLRIFATSSMDCSVQIWNNENKLIRRLQLDDVVHSLTFCSQRGDLVLGMGSSLNFIHHKLYLPQSYIYQMVAMTFPESMEKEPIPIGDNVKLSNNDKNRLFRAHRSFIKFMQFMDEVPEAEKEMIEKEEEIKEKEFKILKARDEELNLLRDGKLKANRKNLSSKMIKTTREEAFEKYLGLFYNRPDIGYPADDATDEEDEDRFIVKMDSSYRPPLRDDGFFGIQASKKDIKKIKSNLRKKRESAVKRKKEAARALANEPSGPRETRSLSIGATTIDEFKEKSTSRPTLSASTTYVERLRAARKGKTETGKDFKFCGEKLEQIEVSASLEYPRNDTTKRTVSKQIIRRLEQNQHAHNPKYDGLPVAPDGFIPNSVVVALYRELRRESGRDSANTDKWKPKELTAEQLDEIERLNKNRKKSLPEEPVEEIINESMSEDEVERTWGELEDKTEEEVEEDNEDDNDVEDSKPVSKFMKQLKTNKSSTMLELDLTTPPITPDPPPKSKSPPPVVEKPKLVKRPTIEKYISRPKVVEEPKATPTVIDIPPPRPSTPLPDFILQFKDLDWFKDLYPVLTSKTFGKPYLDNFIRSLLEKLVRAQDYGTKTNIAGAILLVYQQRGFDEDLKLLVRNTLLSELNLPGGKPSSKSSTKELDFIKKALQVMLEMDMLSIMVVVEMMVQYILGSPLFRKEIMRTFHDLGVQDPKEYFPKELTVGFDVSKIIETEMKSKLRDMCFTWLNDWSKKFKQHITSLSGKICRASNKSFTRNKSILKKNKSNERSKDKEITFVSNEFVSGAAEGISPIDVINYFCEMKLEEEFAKLKADAAKRKEAESKKDKNKNTILMIPKKEGYVSLARIGETHKSRCHPERETSLYYGPALPPIEALTINSLMLHSKKITLAPFPDELDELIYAPQCLHSSLITLKYASKYFIPSRSFVM